MRRAGWEGARERSSQGAKQNACGMPSDSRIEEWLDRWEELNERGEILSIDDFVEQCCEGAPESVIEEFKLRVRALRRIDAQVQAAAPSSSSGDSSAAGESQKGNAESFSNRGWNWPPGTVW